LAEQCEKAGIDNFDADRAIELLAHEKGAAVFTNDKELKKRLFSKGITVVYMRQRRYLEAMKKEF
jgi:rRNA-processing protein FCF1